MIVSICRSWESSLFYSPFSLINPSFSFGLPFFYVDRFSCLFQFLLKGNHPCYWLELISLFTIVSNWGNCFMLGILLSLLLSSLSYSEKGHEELIIPPGFNTIYIYNGIIYWNDSNTNRFTLCTLRLNYVAYTLFCQNEVFIDAYHSETIVLMRI